MACVIVRRARASFTARLEMPRTGSLRAWGAMAADFERLLAEQVSPVVSEARVESETLRGPGSVRVRITVAAGRRRPGGRHRLGLIRTAAGEDITAWDTGARLLRSGRRGRTE